jgi:acyl-CoA thioesterase-1
MRSIKLWLFLLLAFCCSTFPSQANDTSESRKRLLVLGDSLAAGYGLAAEDAFPVQLAKALRQAGHDVTVINAGVSGDTTAGGLARLDWALADKPQLVIVELGGNDALRGLPPEETRANLDAILERLGKAGVKTLLAGMQAPHNLGEHYTTAFNRIYPQLAKQHRVAFYPFFLEGVALDPALNQPDGIHPNARGVAVIVTRILPFVETLLDALDK